MIEISHKQGQLLKVSAEALTEYERLEDERVHLLRTRTLTLVTTPDDAA